MIAHVKWMKVLLIVFLLAAIAMMISLARQFAEMREQGHRTLCACQLSALNIALQFYAGENEHCFPNQPGAIGLEMLCRDHYCDGKFFHCPSRSGPQTLSYVYRGGLKNTPECARQAILWDRPGNHKHYLNVLFADGHVEGILYDHGKIVNRIFYDKEFRKQAAFSPGELPPEILNSIKTR